MQAIKYIITMVFVIFSRDLTCMGWHIDARVDAVHSKQESSTQAERGFF